MRHGRYIPFQLAEVAVPRALFAEILHLMLRRGVLARGGQITGAIMAGYALARMIVELFREPDAHIGFLAPGITMGQLLSLPMLLAGIALIVWARRAPR